MWDQIPKLKLEFQFDFQIFNFGLYLVKKGFKFSFQIGNSEMSEFNKFTFVSNLE